MMESNINISYKMKYEDNKNNYLMLKSIVKSHVDKYNKIQNGGGGCNGSDDDKNIINTNSNETCGGKSYE